MSKQEIPSLMEMMKHGVHFGHQTSRWHPKMEPFIFTTRGGVHIINLEQTQKQLKKAVDFLEKITSEGGEVLFVGTKKQIKDIVKKGAEEAGSPCVSVKWVGGTFTNFRTIGRLIKKMEKYEKQREKGEWERYTKKEQVELGREYDSLVSKVGGIRTMTKLPSAVFVVDITEEKTAVAEARSIGIPVVAVCDTNVNPDRVQYPIPANDDAVRSVKLIVDQVVAAVNAGKDKFEKNPKPNVDKPASKAKSNEKNKGKDELKKKPNFEKKEEKKAQPKTGSDK